MGSLEGSGLLTGPPRREEHGPCSETVQIKKRAKNRIGDDRLPQRARRFFVARDAERPKDENSKLLVAS
jgi:hypothetical protein